jgi:Raf kinase inhibitor-like YbhB/YbcL family protein
MEVSPVNLLLALVLVSSSFTDGATVPRMMVAVQCGGQNVSPPLRWSNVPAGTRSFALIVHDPDAPHPGGFYHWVIYDLPSTLQSLPISARIAAQRAGRNDTGSVGYFGPCPPPGKVHHYHFTLYALDVAHIGTGRPLTATELQARMEGHILAQTTLIGLWSAADR